MDEAEAQCKEALLAQLHSLFLPVLTIGHFFLASRVWGENFKTAVAHFKKKTKGF